MLQFQSGQNFAVSIGDTKNIVSIEDPQPRPLMFKSRIVPSPTWNHYCTNGLQWKQMKKEHTKTSILFTVGYSKPT